MAPYAGYMLYILSMHPTRLFCSKGLFDKLTGHSIIPTGRFLSSKEQFFRRISLALTQVFDDFLFEVIFRVDISITDQLVSSNATIYKLAFCCIRIQVNKDDVIRTTCEQ